MGPGLRLPAGFERAPDLLAMGGELKATFCMTQGGEAVLSPHHGDLEDAGAFDRFRGSLSSYARRFAHAPRAVVVDRHPEYLSAKLAREEARDTGLPLMAVQHHHAHVAACLADNERALGARPVLGIVLDGLGWGEDGTLWGGEFLLADYRKAERLGTFKPVAMLGGDRASREPWRNLYAHLMAEMGWAEFKMNFADLELYRYLEAKPRALLDAMLREGINAPKASSCGRLFDAMAAAVGVCAERQAYEGEAPQRLEALADPRTMAQEDDSLAYPMAIPRLRGSGLPYLEPLALWKAVLGDLILKTPPAEMSARFHKGLARALVAMAKKLRAAAGFDTVALSGGCFQNRLLFGETARRLRLEGFEVLSHRRVPAHDGGLALGQAAVAAARLMKAA
jgi:hydrogenase maturation protein HypF